MSVALPEEDLGVLGIGVGSSEGPWATNVGRGEGVASDECHG